MCGSSERQAICRITHVTDTAFDEAARAQHNIARYEVTVSMSEAVVLLAEQSLLIRTALYFATLALLGGAGGFALALVVSALDAVGGALTANRDWDVLSEVSSKEDVLNLFAVATYASLLISIEPAVRSLASTAGTVLVASLVLAPVAGLIAFNARVQGQR